MGSITGSARFRREVIMHVPTPRFIRVAWALCLTTFAATASAQNTWTSFGPTNVGQVLDVAAGGSVSYAATDNGVFRSEDGGVTWEPAGLEGQFVDRIVAFAGSDTALARSFSAFITRDRGATWGPADTALLYQQAFTVAIDPFRPSTAYFSTIGINGSDIFRSTDSGSTWEPVPPPTNADQPIWAITASFSDGTLYAITADRFFKSADDGATWQQVTAPIASPTAIATGPSGRVYAGREGRICRSADSWTTSTCADFPASPTRIVELPPSAAEPVHVLAASADRLYVSVDGGDTWTPAGGELGSETLSGSADATPSGSLVLAGTGSGIFRSLDRGSSWTRSSTGLRAAEIVSLALDPVDRRTVWAGGEGQGLFRSRDDGRSWLPVGRPDVPRIVDSITLDPRDSRTIYAGGQGPAFARSSDGGASWTGPDSPLPLEASEVHVLAIDPATPDHVWAATDKGLARSDDGGRGFYEGGVSQQIYCLLFDSRSPGTLYAGSYSERVDTSYGPYYEGGRLFRSIDGGESWTEREHRLDDIVRTLAIDPFADGTVLAGLDDGSIVRSEDGGTTWNLAGRLPSSPVISVVADPVRRRTLYAATPLNVYRSTDGSQIWSPLSTGLESVLGPLVISPDGKWLYAGGPDGVYRIDLVTRGIVPRGLDPNRRPRTVVRAPGHPP